MEGHVREIAAKLGVVPLIERYDAIGGVLDYVFLEVVEEPSHERLHREAALRAMAVIDDRLAQWASSRAAHDYPVESSSGFTGTTLSCPASALASPHSGGGHVEPKPLGGSAYTVPMSMAIRPRSFRRMAYKQRRRRRQMSSPGPQVHARRRSRGAGFSLGQPTGPTTSRQARSGGARTTGRSAGPIGHMWSS